MLTREDLEDIMNNKPFGYGKQFMKKGGHKRYTYIARPYKKVNLEPIEVVVLSSDKNAFADAQRQFYTTIAKTIDYDGVEWVRKV